MHRPRLDPVAKQTFEGQLTRDEQLQVCVWFAEQRRTHEVRDLIQATFDKTLEWDSVKYYLRADRWRKLIARLEQRFLDRLTAIPIANKSVRLQRNETIYREAMTEHVIGFTRTGKDVEAEMGVDFDAAGAALERARRELEGEKGVTNKLAALGMKGSGAALKALTKFRQGLASNQYNTYLNRLSEGSGMGAAQTNTTNALAANSAAGQANTIQDMGAARASGQVGAANSWTSALGNFANQSGNWLGKYNDQWKMVGA